MRTALLLGFVAAVVGALLHYLLQRWMSYELGFALMGFMIGHAVLKGAGQGRRLYQWLAVFLTYGAIATTYIPEIGKAITRQDAMWNESADAEPGNMGPLKPLPARPLPATFSPKSVYDRSLYEIDNIFREHIRPLPFLGRMVSFSALLFGLAFAAPFLYGKVGAIRLFLIALALIEAWRINRVKPAS